MIEKKSYIFFYALIGVGYLLFCSAIPSMIAINLASVFGGELNSFYAILSFVTGILFVGILFLKMKEPLDAFSNISVKGVLEAIVAALILFVVINFMVSPILSVLFPASADNYSSNVTDMISTPVATFFQVVIIAPLFEELIFRGFILKRALRESSTAFAVLMTAILFGVLHLSIIQGISAAAAGIVLCVFYVRRRSVGLNILAHSIYNGMVFILTLYLGGLV